MTTFRFSALSALVLLANTAALAEPASTKDKATAKVAPATMMTTVPGDGVSITHWYKKNVYDSSNSKVGEIDDIIANRQGQIVAFILGVGGFLGIGEKHVAVPFNAIHITTRNNDRWYLVMNTTADALRAAPNLNYDRSGGVWSVSRETPADAKKKSESKNPPKDTPPK